MITVYAFATPDSIRGPIALEELQLDYQLQAVNVRQGEQKRPEFVAINPNGKVPVISDPEGPDGKPFVLTESGAILMYLAEKTGKLIPNEPFGRGRVIQQLFFHMTGGGPAMGQLGFFTRQAPEPIPLAINQFRAESERVLSVLDSYLSQRLFTADDTFSIADIARYGWLWRREFAGLDFSRTPPIARCYDLIAQRPAVIRATERVTALVPAV